jgi:hypothetical protein
MRHMMQAWLVRGSVLGLVGVLMAPGGAVAQSAPSIMVDKTPSYTVELSVGPAEQMVMPGQMMGATSGEVMVSGGPMSSSGMSSSSNSMGSSSGMGMGSSSSMSTDMDQGMGVNHHLEIHIMRNDDNSVVSDVTPVIRVTDKSTGISRDLPEVMGMYGVGMGMSDFHYGQNVWLPDGTYTITAMIGPDTAVFRDVQVMAGSPMAMGASSSMGSSMGSSSSSMGMGH